MTNWLSGSNRSFLIHTHSKGLIRIVTLSQLLLCSGVMGSGLATFSRYPIEQAFFRRYSLNGEPHRIFHGDWFSGKGVGACRIRLPIENQANEPCIIDFYNTHLHAEYDVHTNFYMVHRMCQLQELVQFVELSSRSDNLVVVVGDLNTIPDSIPYDLLFKKHALSNHALLFDTWQQAKGAKVSGRIFKVSDDENSSAIETIGCTFNLPKNSYHTNGPVEKLDYVMTAKRNGLKCIDSGVLVNDKVLGSEVSLSDHSLVWATLSFQPGSMQTDEITPTSPEDKISAARQAIQIMRAEINRVKSSIRSCHILCAVLFGIFLSLFTVVLVTFITQSISVGVLFGLFCIQPVILTAAVLVLFMARVWLQEQLAALIAFKREWNLLILSLEQAKNTQIDGIANLSDHADL